jgi:hypothetical protein
VNHPEGALDLLAADGRRLRWTVVGISLFESESEMARMEALKFLEVNSAKEDLEAFQIVASRDPFEAEPAPRYFDIPGADRELEDKPRARIFPLRFLAEHALGMHAGQTITGPRSPILGIP